MSRRLVAALSACCVAALSVTAVAFAHGGGDRHGDRAHQRAAVHAKHRTGPPAEFLSRGAFAASLNSLARRLNVDPATLRAAVKAVIREQRAKAKAAPHAKPDLAALKTELATSLGAKIGKTPDEVLAAVRAELDARLTQAVQAGWLTQKGHDLALACFDTPDSCDLKALRGEVRFGGHRPSSGDQSSGSASSSAPSGTMMPGARSTSTPLR